MLAGPGSEGVHPSRGNGAEFGGGSVSPQQNSGDLGNQPCGRCGKPQGSTLTERVDGRGPGWKCACGWWTWFTGNKADYRGSVMTAIPPVFMRKLEHLKAGRL